MGGGSGKYILCGFFYFQGYFYFLICTIFKVFIEFVTLLLLFHVLVFLAARHAGS